MTPSRPYHHGNLRQAVLDRAVVALREKGAAELSMRELAADIGVTHAAPRRYFPDRQALLDALAADGFVRLGARLRQAVAGAPEYRDQVRSLAVAYTDFAVSEANLVELMFAHKRGEDGPEVARSATEAFWPMLEVFRRGHAEGRLPGRDPERGALLFLASLQGVAGLFNCGVVPTGQLDALVDDAAAQFSGTPEPRP